MPFLEIDGCRLEARWCGEERSTGPSLVLLHEGLGSIAAWGDFPEHLAERTGRRCLLYSRCGYGGSGARPAAPAADYLHHEARVVLPELLEKVGAGDCILVGHSDGASIALIFAASRPRGLRGAVLEAPHVFVEELTVAGVRAAGRDYARGALRRRLERQHGEKADDVFFGWHDLWVDPAFRSWSLSDLLPSVRCPLLLVQGEDDPYGTLAQVRTIARRTNGPCEELVLEGCGHIPHRERAEAVTSAISRFVSRVEGDGGDG